MAHVLVIDDDRQMRSLLRQMLERDGHEVAEAEDGLQGIGVFATQRIDLAMIDLYMPGKSGWETIRALQQAAPGLPFVIVSGSAPLELLTSGATGTLDSVRRLAEFRVLRKPFDWGTVSAAVHALLLADGSTGG